MPQEVEQRGDEGSDIGPSGSAKNVINRFGFGSWGDELHFGQNLERSARCIEFNGEGNQVEEHDGAPSSDHDGEVGLGVEAAEAGEEAKQGKPSNDLTCKGSCTYRGHSPLERGVGDFVLDGMPTLVCCNAEGRGRVSVEILGG